MKYIVRYNVEFSREIEANSEKEAIEKALASEDSNDAWDQVATSQYEAEEAL